MIDYFVPRSGHFLGPIYVIENDKTILMNVFYSMFKVINGSFERMIAINKDKVEKLIII
jgi:hypothetical protein